MSDREKRNRDEAMLRLRRNREEVLRRQRRNREVEAVRHPRHHAAGHMAAGEVRVERVPNVYQPQEEQRRGDNNQLNNMPMD